MASDFCAACLAALETAGGIELECGPEIIIFDIIETHLIKTDTALRPVMKICFQFPDSAQSQPSHRISVETGQSNAEIAVK